MSKVPKIAPIPDLRQEDVGSIIKRVSNSRDPLFITQHGRASAVMVSMKEYELEILRLLARGEQDIEAGVGFDLEVVLSEADALLAGARGRIKTTI